MINRHFTLRGNDFLGDPPKRLYARLDDVQLPGPQATKVRLAFDAVDADWLNEQGHTDPLFDFSNLADLEKAWEDQWDASKKVAGSSPFGTMPLYRLEVECSWGAGVIEGKFLSDFVDSGNPDTGLAKQESTWFEFDVLPHHSAEFTQANLYPGLFVPPMAAWVRGKVTSPVAGKALSSIFDFSHVAALLTSGFSLGGAVADLLGVYDVGQGSASALLDDKGRATLFYDLGCGVYANHSTAPASLSFCCCVSPDPMVLLSHWDVDHWAGAYWAASASGPFPALSKTWIAPDQKPGPVHTAFAYDIFRFGSLYLWRGGVIAPVPMGTRTGRRAHLALGSGTTKNYSGIVLGVEDSSPASSSLVLTGDCDYRYFWAAMTVPSPVALIAPHHGADLTATSTPPPPSPGSYRRIVYSFGPNNTHSGVRHPTAGGMNPHISAGWDHGTWPSDPPPGPGSSIPGADALATCVHGSTVRDSIVVGWTLPSTPLHNCGGTRCTTTLRQS